MTRDEFLRAVRQNGIAEGAFQFNAPGNECYVLEAGADGWDVYYGERGLRTGLRRFATESEGLEDLLARLRGDASARRGPTEDENDEGAIRGHRPRARCR